MGTLLERTYTAWGAVKTEKDGEGNETIHHYDDLERLERQELPEDREVSYNDAAGNLKEECNGYRTSVIEANGHVTTFEYDARNVLVRVNAPETAITRYELDEMGDRVKETDPAGKVVERTLDDRPRVESETSGSDTTTSAYDLADNLTEITRPATRTWIRVYDDANRLESITGPSGGVTSYRYDENSNLVEQRDA